MCYSLSTHYPWICSSCFGFPDASAGKESTCNAGDTGDEGSIPGLRRSLEGEKTAHSGILAQKTPWTEDPGGPHSGRSQRVKRAWAHTAQRNYASLCQPPAYKPLLTQWHMVTHQTYAFQMINPSPWPFTRALLAPLELSGLVIHFCLDSTFFLYLDLLTNILAMC